LLFLSCQTESFTQYKVYGQVPESSIPKSILRMRDYILYPPYRFSSQFSTDSERVLPHINWFGSCECTNGNVCKNECNWGQPTCDGTECKCGASQQYGVDQTAII
jgi:hypothetical protein